MLFRISPKQNAVNCRKMRLLQLATRFLGLDTLLREKQFRSTRPACALIPYIAPRT
jgi:hypothetical protein